MSGHVGDERSQPWFWIKTATTKALRRGLCEDDPGLSQVLAIYTALVELANSARARTDQDAQESGSFTATRRQVAAYAGTSTKTVDRAADTLERIGLLRVERTRVEGDRNLPNRYWLRDPELGDSESPTQDSESGTLGDSESHKSSRRNSTQEPRKSPPSEIEEVWAHFVDQMDKRGKGKLLGSGERKIIRDALEAGEVEELKLCITTCRRSCYHMKRGEHADRKGNRFNSLGVIFKPRPRLGQTQRSRIEWWAEYAAELDKGGDGDAFQRFLDKGAES